MLERPRLLQLLSPVQQCRLGVVCAGAGFGKTTLLAQWHQQMVAQGERIAWLSLDEDDDDVWQFIPYLLQALRPLYADWDADFWRDMEEQKLSSSEQLLAGLINQLHYCPHDVYLIIDDFHVINDRGVYEALGYLIKHAPAALHLIIGSRFHPNLALSQLQAQDQLVEIYDRDLQFTLEETKHYFSRTVALPLSNHHAQRLQSVTEGWIAGMKIASLSAELQNDPEHLLRNMHGGTRSIARYLKEVVLDPLPEEVLDFLVKTSFLSRLNAELCNAVTGRDDSKAMLAWIERHNLFLSALDEQGYWFRYHPLLQENLRTMLQQNNDIDRKQLHELASHWFVEQKLWSEAVRHALSAGKPVHSPVQDGASAQSLAEEGDIDTLISWMHHLPPSTDPSRIDLQINLAWALAHYFHFDESRQLLDNLDQMVLHHREDLTRSTWCKLRVVRAICEAFAENIPESLAIVQPLLAEVPCGDTWVDGLICNILSYCHVVNQRYHDALEVQQHMPSPESPLDNLFVSVYRAFIIAQCHLCQGDLGKAGWYAEKTLRQAEFVFRRGDGHAFAKIAPASRRGELAGERDRLIWLKGRGVACPEVINWQEEQEGACLVITAIPGVPAADLSGADLLKAWPSMGQQLGAVHSLSVDQCPFERRLSRMFGRAVDVVSRNAVNPDFLPDEDKSTPQLDLLARVERELPVRLDQERTDMVVCHGDPCMPNFMVDPKTLQCTGLIDLGRLGTADRYADLALMIANAEENWAAPDEAERAFAVLFNVLGIEAPDRERLAFYLRLDPLTWG
ncbi:TPA: APH(3'') family aminoglycoside O-phosphotransferase [Klebsiella pneumoniae]|nr:APH(3'') family aminoglycoside O-phosphotransferase [Klebsiella pneumoniae]EIW0203436.1 APH(3'') family aminoglycoside O-phosphotransferase [Klebsiella pneumoniae]EIW1550664.1 APH(3'') family aminoglycoside O-phosphotransferase [Klebsiella pneumoniae]EIW1552712.1 APH(3'') family aminoglycoside O-phosphotransferase [Klebsiella pneumoniae]HBV4503551.1 APH(3'') family aminoglycoside O-phosphotransferase [Klebsiella pneumoniae]